jgi:hypothetical protein
MREKLRLFRRAPHDARNQIRDTQQRGAQQSAARDEKSINQPMVERQSGTGPMIGNRLLWEPRGDCPATAST